MWDNAAGKCHVRTFPSHEAARSWRHEVLVLVRRRGTVAPGRYEVPTVAEALDALIVGMRDGSVLDRSGKEYKPATVRSYEQAVRRYLKPRLGRHRLDALERGHVQALVDGLRRKGLKPSTVHNKLDPLRVVYRRAVNRDLVGTDPTANLELPLVRGRRERVVSRERARLFLDTLPEGERALWATALYGGLRVGELRALRWRDVDIEGRKIHVRRAWDDVAGEIEVKSDAGRRKVPLAGRLSAELEVHRARTNRSEGDLVFGRTPQEAFIRTTVRRRAIRAVEQHNAKVRARAQAEGREQLDELVELLTPHEARHTAASYLIAAGLNAKQLQTYIGHSDIRTTYNVYGHLFEGDEIVAAEQLDRYLDAA